MSRAEVPTASVESSVEWIRAFEERSLDAWNSRRPERLLALMTKDIEYRDDAWPKAMHGHDEVREFLESLWTAFPDLTFEVIDGPYVIPGEPRSVMYWRGWGTHRGPLEPYGLAATGRRWEGDGVNIQAYRDGRICRLRICADMLSAWRQLGLLPPR